MNKQGFQVLGIMSGTSLDGVDLAHVTFMKENCGWSYELKKAVTVSHDPEIHQQLTTIAFSDVATLDKLNIQFGEFLGEMINRHFEKSLGQIDFIASHGHTAKHCPEDGYTIQIGDAKSIVDATQKPVINNFRAKDVSLGGQGAPLVPIGDRDLFHEYDYCLNLGGIANISFESNGKRVAFDISPFNMALNRQSQMLGMDYDKDGNLAEKGVIQEELLRELNSIPFYNYGYPKSLGFEDYMTVWDPILNNSSSSVANKLRTLIEHFAVQICNVCDGDSNLRMIVTGGGAYNQFFMKTLRKRAKGLKIEVPNKEIIDFKEAIIFAYLGVLRYSGLPNCLASVTGASSDNSGGEMFGF